MAIQDALFYSQVPIDNIIAIYEGDLTIPERTDPDAVVAIPTGINDTTFFQGRFYIDGEDYANDIGGFKFINDGAGDFTRIGLRAKSTAGFITLTTSTNDVVTHSCHYEIALIAKPSQGVINVGSPTLPEYFYTERNYQKIALDDVRPVTLSTGFNTTTIPHGLTYRPSFRCFIANSTTLVDAMSEASVVNDVVNTSLTAVDIYADNTNIYVQLPYLDSDSPSVTLYTRVYYDPS